MNVYDFDQTIYNGDSTLDFYLYCLKNYHKTWLSLPFTCFMSIIYRLHLCRCETFKEVFYRFVKYVPNIEKAVINFWNTHRHKIKSWYISKKDKSDIIISASPEFLIKHICEYLEVKCIASKVNPQTGKLESPNCKSEEKVRRFLLEYPSHKINNFFSDSLSDIYMAKLATQAYLVHENKIKEWKYDNNTINYN